MKNMNLVLLLGFAWSSWVFATPKILDAHFGAPAVSGHTNVQNPSYGEIILDQSDGNFYGYTPNSGGAWVNFSAPTTAPTVTVMTSATCSSGYTPPTGTLYIRVTMVGAGGGGGGTGSGASAGSSGGNTSLVVLAGYQPLPHMGALAVALEAVLGVPVEVPL